MHDPDTPAHPAPPAHAAHAAHAAHPAPPHPPSRDDIAMMTAVAGTDPFARVAAPALARALATLRARVSEVPTPVLIRQIADGLPVWAQSRGFDASAVRTGLSGLRANTADEMREAHLAFWARLLVLDANL